MRTLRWLVVCLAWVFCAAPPAAARLTDPVALVVGATAAAYVLSSEAPSETPADVRTESAAPRAADPPLRPSYPRLVSAAPANTGGESLPPVCRYLRNCALLC